MHPILFQLPTRNAVEPGTIWPPLAPGAQGKYLCLVIVPGVGYRYTVIDTNLKPDQGPIGERPPHVSGQPVPGGERPPHVSGQPVPPVAGTPLPPTALPLPVTFLHRKREAVA